MKKVIVFIFAALLFLCSCNIEQEPNLVIINAYADGWLKVYSMDAREHIVDQAMPFNSQVDLFLEIGGYNIRLIVDQTKNPVKNDRMVGIGIIDLNQLNEIIFK